MIEEQSVKLLLGVARLGEADLFGWWRSRGFTEAGEYVLGNAFRRTWSWTAFEGAVLSAARRHEEALGRATAIHLFSDQLPVKGWALAWLREQKAARRTDGWLSQLRRWDRRSACEEIARWAAIEPPQGEVLAEGRRLGSVSQGDMQIRERVERVIRTLAAAYVDRPEDFRLPYFNLS